MTAAPASQRGPVSSYVKKRLADLLDARRVVVWYDPEGAFGDLIKNLDLPNCTIVSAASSRLRARREAEAAYRRLEEPDGGPEARRNLLIYVPGPRGSTPEQQQQDPFEGFARCGAAFGDGEAERLVSLAQLALPDRREEIARLFRDGRPTLALLDALPAGARFPMVRQALGTDAPVETVVRALSQPDTAERLSAVPGALEELARLAHAELGLPTGPATSWPALRERLSRYLLTSELAADLPGGLPAALAAVPHADHAHQQLALEICERLRDSDAGREAYSQLATAVEQDLRLPAQLPGDLPLGTHDTFACQERARLHSVVRAAAKGDLTTARSLLNAGERSVWRRDPERALLWQVVQRCLAFLERAVEVEAATPSKTVRSLIEAYTAADGFWRLDQAQRLFEQAGAHCAEEDEVEPLLQTCRRRYRDVVGPFQAAFQAAVRAEGWPPEGVRRQTQTFDGHVLPELQERRKTVYFLVDSLRYEMGRDLADALVDLGPATVEGVASVLPTTTACGMAALMPGADGAYTLLEHRGGLVPAVAGLPLPDRAERTALLASRFGDRVADITLEELLSTAPKRLGNRIGQADLVVVRTQDIDELGEGQSLFRARKVMGEVIGELRSAAIRLAAIGFETLVFSADHGHVLTPEILPGDVLSTPPGEWRLKKRRSLLGHAQGSAPGVLVLRAQHVGILGSAEDFAAAADFKTFQAGAGYFHEGLSLQECIVPVVVVRARRQQTVGGGEQVSISYRSDRFTSSIVGLKMRLIAMFQKSLAVRLEAFDGTGPKANPVGRAGDCDARDPATGEIVLQADTEIAVPMVVDPEFRGPSIEVRAVDPRTGVVLARLSLRNARMD